MHNVSGDKIRRDPRYFDARTACPICQSARIELLYVAPYAADPVRSFVESHYRRQGRVDWALLEGTDFLVSACMDCDAIFQNQVPNEFLLDKIYNEMIAQDGLFELSLRRLTLQGFEAVAGELTVLFGLLGKPPPDVRFLDYGFGYGRWARVAAALGAAVYATEISPEKIAFARQMHVQVIGDADLPRMQFDLIHTEQVFEHLTHPRETFALLAGALAPGGIMKVAVPPAGRIRSRLATSGMVTASPSEATWHSDRETRRAARNKDYVCLVPLEHLNVFSAKSMKVLAQQNGLRLSSRTRRQAVPVCFASAGTTLRSLLQLARVSLRPVLRRDSGYYVFSRPGITA